MTRLVKSLQAELFRIVFYQLIIIMGLTLIILLLKGTQKGLSAFAGALAYWLPTLFFVWRVSVHAGARAATRFLFAFFTGEVVKLALSGVIFLFIIKYAHAQLLYALFGFIAAILAFWMASIFSLYRSGVKS